MINPFSCNTESLVNVAAGVVLPQDVADSLLASRPKGQEQMTTFVKKRINSHDVSFWHSIPNLKIKTFSSMSKKVKVKYGDDKSITVHADRDLFGRLLIVANVRQINLQEVLSYELSPIPCALAHQVGSLRKTTKSHLAGIIEKLVNVVPRFGYTVRKENKTLVHTIICCSRNSLRHSRKFKQHTPLFSDLHSLPIKYRIDFKM